MRVFLSYSSKDKFLIDQVANRLGRAFVLYDSFSFETGKEFVDSIVEKVGASNLFALFASKHSITSEWVNLEIEEARRLKLRALVRKIIVFLIDDSVKIADLPDSLQKITAMRTDSATQITREIRMHLHQLIEESQSPIFVNRRQEIETAERLLAPLDTLEEPHAFCFYGLEGIGRKTLCKHVAKGLLGLPKIIVIRINDGDELPELLSKMYEQLDPSKTTQEIKNRLLTFEESTEVERIKEFSSYTARLIEARELLVLQDNGGMLDNDGFFSEAMRAIISAAQNSDSVRLALISKRRPSFTQTDHIPCIKVPHLETLDIKRLLKRRFRDLRITSSDAEISDLSTYIAGYPPAVTFVAEIAHRIGVQQVIHDKSPVVEFTATYMIKALEERNRLSGTQKKS